MATSYKSDNLSPPLDRFHTRAHHKESVIECQRQLPFSARVASRIHMGSDIESTSSAPETANRAEDLARIDPSSEARNQTSSNASGSATGGKAGWLLLGAAALLAAGSVGYNVYEGGGTDSEPAAVDTAAQSMDALREAAENSTDDARPWSELAFAHYGRGEFAEAAEAYEQAIAIDGEGHSIIQQKKTKRHRSSATDEMKETHQQPILDQDPD